MFRSLQPCDWYEHDVRGKYVIDVFGRTDKNQVACLRINGFRPYFYLRATKKPTIGTPIAEKRYDVLAGFNNLEAIDVWKVVCDSKEMFSNAIKSVQGIQYESNLPPFLRFFHDRDISPASPIRFKEHQYTIPTIPVVDEDEVPRPLYAVDVFYQCDLTEVEPDLNTNIPLKVACYDLEMYSHSGLFPRAFEDPIVQIGISYRWSNDMLNPIRRRVFVVGTVDTCDDPTIEFVACPTEKEMMYKFAYEIRTQNPDIMCGYNTFGFDDAYIEDRCKALGITEEIDLARYQSKTKAKDGRWVMKFTETKKFELASGKYDLRFLCMRGRLGLDLLLNMRREHSLDSFKLDSVASVFLRDKVLEYKNDRINTKSTRGLRVGNFVRFDIVGNTTDPYREGEKYRVLTVDSKGFTIDSPGDLFADLTEKERKSLEWTLSKDDVEPAELFELHAHGGPAGRARIAKYCIQDCDLVLTLMSKLDTIVNARGMADVCKVPMEYVLRRGQGIKIFSAILYYASKRKQILRVQEALDDDTGYEGAIVLPPKVGMYLDQPISVLDYNSLYPTNMISYNLSPDTLVAVRVMTADGHLLQHECEGMTPAQMEEVRNQGWVIEEIEYDNKNDKDEITGKTKCYYVQPNPDNELSIGVIPKTLDILLKKRKEFKEKMEDKQYDEAQRSVYNGLQLAYKVVANSVYGQCGSRTSPIRKLCVAASTTAAGRKMLNFAKHIVESEYGATVIYGDSVASYTPVTIRENNRISIIGIEELGRRGQWLRTADGEKEFCELSGIETWSDSGWTPLYRIIRHQLAPHKKMVRVLTHGGLVDVTDDHSLLRNTKEEVSPKDLKAGDTLLHHVYPDGHWYTSDQSRIEEARILGFFCGDGSCGFYNCPSGDKASWALNNSNIELLEEYQKLCSRVYPELTWNILPTLLSSGVFKLVPNGKGLKEFIIKYREQAYVDKRKNIPDWIMNGSHEVRQAFWDGFYDADGDKDLLGFVRFDQKHQTTSAQLAWIGASFGYKVSVNTRSDKPDICRLTFTQNSQRKPIDQIKKIETIEYSGYVYDLTTDNHHFQAGVGTMIVHNTDSIFIKFPTKELVESIKMGIEAGKRITDLSRTPYKIAYEKTFYPFILFCRKRYVGMMYEEDPNIKPKRKSMGIVLKRRDNAPIVKDVFGGALDMLLTEKNVKKAQQFTMEMLHKVLENQVPLEKFIVSKSLRDDYKIPGQIAHRVLADRMQSRDPGTAPKVGDRLQYIYVAENKSKAKQGDRIEEVGYVRKNKLTPDSQFYISNQIQNPVAQLFALCIEDLDGYVPPKSPTYAQMYETYLEKFQGDRQEEDATLKVLSQKEKQLENIMFLGSPQLAKIIRKNTRGPMDAWLKR